MLRNILRHLIFLTLDGVGVVFCIVLSLLLKFGSVVPQENLQLFINYFYVIVVFHLIVFLLGGLYRFNEMPSFVDMIYRNIWIETLIIFGLTIFFLTIHTYYRPDLNTSRTIMIYLWGLTLIYLSLWRYGYYIYRKKKGSLKHRTVVIGIPEESSELAKSLESYSQSGHTVLGFIHPHVRNHPQHQANEIKTNIVGGIDSLEPFVAEHDIHDIIIIANLTPSSLLEIIDICQRTPCQVWIYPSLYEVMIGRLQIQEIAGLPLIAVDPSPLSGWYGFAKRAMDIIASGIGLLLSIPIMLIVIPVVKMDSPGPVFYTQKRIGKGNKIFQLSKFRTMRQDAEKNTGAVWAQANDPRITRVGKFMRKTRLDEIPQLFNILKGDMSLIGPRPERPELMEKFTITSPHFHRRLAIRPGLTGLAQIQGRYDLDIESKLRYDLAYIYNVNLLLDLKILLATVKVVFTGKGAM